MLEKAKFLRETQHMYYFHMEIQMENVDSNLGKHWVLIVKQVQMQRQRQIFREEYNNVNTTNIV